MQPVNNLIFDSTNAASGGWRNISNFVSFSVHGVNLEGKVWIEVSNDPNVMIDSSTNLSAPSAPTLSQFAWTPSAGINPTPTGLTGQGTLYVKATYITKWGETTGSVESSLAVSDGYVLSVQSPAQDANGVATGWNVYIGKSSGAEVLQTGPAYAPARVTDVGGYSYAYNGVIPIGTNFNLVNGFQYGTVAPPSSNTAGGIGQGVNAYYLWSGTGPAAGPGGSTGEEGVYSDTNNGNQTLWAPSCLFFNFIRIVKDTTSQSKETKVWLFGCNG